MTFSASWVSLAGVGCDLSSRNNFSAGVRFAWVKYSLNEGIWSPFGRVQLLTVA